MATQTAVVAAGSGNPTPCPITTPFNVPAGQVVGVYVTTAGPGGGSQLNYITGTSFGAPWVSDAFLTIYEGAGECAYFGGGLNRPRNFSGNIHYNPECSGECVAPINLVPTVTGVPGTRAADDTEIVDTSVCGIDAYTPACAGTADETFVRFTAPFDGTVTVDTCGAGTTYDTVLAVAEGACGALSELTCNDDTCGAQSQVTFTMVAGTDYRIIVDGAGGATGAAEVRVQMTEVPTDYLPCFTPPNAVGVANPRVAAVPGPVTLVPTVTSGGTLGNVT